MIVLEAIFLIVFWTWVFSGVLFLRNTVLPKAPVWVSESLQALPHESVKFQATDGLWLAGSKIPADPNAPWLILCHGLGTNRDDVRDTALALHQAGLNLLLFDFRAHGQSEGRVTSFGWREQRDLEGALVFLGSQPDIPANPYGVFGLSMGGAVAVMVASKDERIGAVAVDSIYSDLNASITHHIQLLYHLPQVPFGLFVGSAYRLRFGVWPRHMSPKAVIGRISPRPVLLIQGEADPRIPLAEAQALYAAAKDPKELWVVRGGTHLGGLAVDPAAYHAKLIQFFRSALKSSYQP